jgi:integrating conjugative element protein (TIGR03757 family)
MTTAWFKRSAICAALLVSDVSLAGSDIHSVRIFHTGNQPVMGDIRLPETIPVIVYDMDTKARTETIVNSQVQAMLPRGLTASNYESANREAFNALLNSPQWRDINEQLEVGNVAIDAAVRFGIEKLPAIVFNNQQVVYGQRSLKAAIQAYERENN